jgi:chemotaxis protein methyltransferase CheR
MAVARTSAIASPISIAVPPDPQREFAFSDEDFQFLTRLAYQRAGIALSESKRNLVYGRLSRRLRALNLTSFAQYRELVDGGDDTEIERFINSISTNHTKFFRESHHFDHFRTNVAAAFAASKTSRRLRIWSAGCSTGEEPYTIAVVLRREIADIAQRDVRILATDIDTDVLAKASRGEFAADAMDSIPDAYCRYFEPCGEGGSSGIAAHREIRALITFRRLNLMESWPFKGPFDAVFCRNVMIYFDGPTKNKLVDRFTQMIRPGGWLYIGHSESLLGAHPGLKLEGRTIYRREA